MPLIKIDNISNYSCWGLWKIEETTESLQNQSFLSHEELTELEHISNLKRKKEWLGARVLLKDIISNHLSLEYHGTHKDEHNKPFLHHHDIHISIAHCFPFAVTLINRNHACGIDIETPKPALFHVASKFLSIEELKVIKNKPDDLCLAWSAKEVLYKMLGQKKINFKNNLHIIPESLKSKQGRIKAEIELPEITYTVTLVYEIRENYIICYSL